MSILTPLERLEQMAHNKNITIYDYHIDNVCKGACCQIGNIKAIALDKKTMASEAEETEILAEEIGHYETGALYKIDATINSPISRSNIIKFEAQAKQWSYRELLPFQSIQSAIDMYRIDNIEELAEYFNLLPDFVSEALNYYRTLGIEIEFLICEG